VSRFIAETTVASLHRSFERGQSVRQVATAMNLSKVTVQRYRKLWLEGGGVVPRCDCGQDAGHKGWCQTRFKESSARQAAVAQFAVFGRDAGPCRACGAKLAPRTEKNQFDICDTCLGSLSVFSGAEYDWDRKAWNVSTLTEETFLAWLARKLVKDMQRHERNGLMGRCEALTNQGDSLGYQCGLVATRWHEDHKVCSRHANAVQNIYVSERTADYYQIVRDHLTALSAADPRFATIIREVAKMEALARN
jgi:hypothetical protein